MDLLSLERDQVAQYHVKWRDFICANRMDNMELNDDDGISYDTLILITYSATVISELC